MILIEKRPLKDKRLGRYQCHNCKSVFQTEESDIALMTFHAADYQDPRESDWYGIPCPVCSTEVSMSFPVVKDGAKWRLMNWEERKKEYGG